MLKPHKINTPLTAKQVNDYARQFWGDKDSTIRVRLKRYREALAIDPPVGNVYPPKDAELLINLIVWKAQGKTIKEYIEELNRDYAASRTDREAAN